MELSPDPGKHLDTLLDSILHWAIFNWEWWNMEGKSSLESLCLAPNLRIWKATHVLFSHALNLKTRLGPLCHKPQKSDPRHLSFFKPLPPQSLFDEQIDSCFEVPHWMVEWLHSLLLSMMATATSRSAASWMNCSHFITYLQNISESQLHKLLPASALSNSIGIRASMQIELLIRAGRQDWE
jgi:hypothetical protein